MDSTNLAEPLDQYIRGLRQDQELERNVRDHDPRHGVRSAAIAGILTLAAVRLIGEARLQNFLVLRSQRSLLSKAAGFRRIMVAATHPKPAAGQIRITGIVEGLRPGNGYGDCRHECEQTDRALAKHRVSVSVSPLEKSSGARCTRR